jgi:hypothetical protein
MNFWTFLKHRIRIFMCARFNVKVSQCIARQGTFYLVTGRTSSLECKSCTREIKMLIG